jgi:hypothetical protein
LLKFISPRPDLGVRWIWMKMKWMMV